jgi:hypothetical protein
MTSSDVHNLYFILLRITSLLVVWGAHCALTFYYFLLRWDHAGNYCICFVIVRFCIGWQCLPLLTVWSCDTPWWCSIQSVPRALSELCIFIAASQFVRKLGMRIILVCVLKTHSGHSLRSHVLVSLLSKNESRLIKSPVSLSPTSNFEPLLVQR